LALPGAGRRKKEKGLEKKYNLGFVLAGYVQEKGRKGIHGL